jgi:heme exporter protein B
MLSAAKYFFLTEILLLWRRSQEWLYPLAFFLIIICLFPLAFTPDPIFLQKYIPGCIWIAALLASLLSIENIFYTDMEEGYLEQLLLSQLPLSFLVLIKLNVQWLVTQVPLILLTPLLGLMFHLSATTILTLCASLLLGTPILVLMGSLCVALTLGLRQQGVLLGLLVFPLVTPVLIFGVSLVQQSQAGLSILGPLTFLGGLMMFTITLLPVTIAAMLRAGMDD